MRRIAGLAAVAFVISASSALAAGASPGAPPPGTSPVAGSIYKAQFALCSLQTIAGLARSEQIAIGRLAPGAAAKRVAQAHEQDRGSAAVSGCKAGLLYRGRNDQALVNLRSELSDRIVAEKYVIGVYALVVVAFFAWVIIHAARVSRLERTVEAVTRALEESSAPR